MLEDLCHVDSGTLTLQEKEWFEVKIIAKANNKVQVFGCIWYTVRRTESLYIPHTILIE